MDDLINKDNHIPTPPSPEGAWSDKRRDHPYFQNIVSLAAIGGGASSTAGCLTIAAKLARTTAEQAYFARQIADKADSTINEKKI